MAHICYKPKGSCATCEHLRPDPDYYDGTLNCCWEDWDNKHPEEFQKILAETKEKELKELKRLKEKYEKNNKEE